MNKKILITLGILVVIIALLGVYVIYVHKSTLTEEQLKERFSEFRTQYQEKKTQGYDVIEAEELIRKAKQAFEREDYVEANKYLDKAFEALEKAKIPVIPEEVKEEARKRLSQVKVASVYQRPTDGAAINRTVDDVINILKETKTDFIFRGWWRFHPCPESPTESSGFFSSDELAKAMEKGYTYEHLKNAIAKIKKEMPDVIFCGAIGAQFLHVKKDRNPITGEIFDRDETWAMALDPSKWGINMTKEEFLEEWSENHVGYGINGPFYYPDITNPEFQKLLLSWAKKQIDCGADAIWIDLLYTQAGMFEGYAKEHPEEAEKAHKASKDSYEAASKIVDEIHNYGYSKYGKYIYVGTWLYPTVSLPYTPPKLDFVTLTTQQKEVLFMEFSESMWDKKVRDVSSNFGDIPIFTLLDWAAGTNTSLGVFSQRLTPDQQRKFLKEADEFFQKKGIIFVYPIHGGSMGKDAKILSFGKFNIYDSLAPEFQTYETIKELAQNKTKP
jgi:hypothetical protein